MSICNAYRHKGVNKRVTVIPKGKWLGWINLGGELFSSKYSFIFF